VQLVGRVSDPLGRRLVHLYASPYPYPPATLIATAAASPDGAFDFRAVPDRNTRYRAVLAGTPAMSSVRVGVAGTLKIKVDALPLGRARVTILVSHPPDLPWGGAPVRWSFALGSQGRFFTEPATRTRASRPGLTVLSTSVTLPAGGLSVQSVLRRGRRRGLARPRAATGLRRSWVLRKWSPARRLSLAGGDLAGGVLPRGTGGTDGVRGHRQ
jgi:hypothetical protein